MNTGDRIPDKRKYLLENFGRAMQEGWLEVYYQPIIRGSSGRVCGEEALVRWDDPMLGVLNPAEFIPILESVNLIDRLDLYVLEQVIAKLEKFEEIGLYRVVHSVNFSQIDFFSSDIVSEVKQRLEGTSVPPSLIAIDIIESACGTRNETVLSKLQEFHELGFQIWMDDYGNGDLAPILLQQIHFDLLKINMSLVSQLRFNKGARVVSTELVRMAMGLGIEVAAEGVEAEEEVEFLSEIGCAKLQGFYFCKPVSLAELLDRYDKGIQIGFENPDEREYYSTVGHVSLYDLSFASNEENGFIDYFDTLPMAILQVNSEEITLLRCNGNFRKFCYANFSDQRGVSTYYFKSLGNHVGLYAMNAVRQCGVDGKRVIVDERTKNGKMVQTLVDKISQNPVTGMSAVAVVILSVTDIPNSSEDLTYNYIARALAEDYIKLYFVDMEKDEFVEYVSDGKNRDVSVVDRGTNYFDQPELEKYKFVYKEDRPRFIDSFTKENVIRDLNQYGKYTLTYRTVMDGKPTYVNLKAVRVRTDNRHIIIGISNVDAHTREQEAFQRIKEERITFNRIAALSSDFINIYSVDPETGFYEIFKMNPENMLYELEPEGKDFFKESRDRLKEIVYEEDVDSLMKVFTKEHILESIKQRGLFTYTCRIKRIKGGLRYVTMKTALVEELDGPQLIFGLIDVDEQVRKEKEFAEKVSEAEDKAIRDELTGVKNKHAYAIAEEEFNVKIEAGKASEFAIVVCDLNGLKDVNDNFGHQTGDEFIRAGCKIICTVFAHSPVYRVGGDEFVVIAQGADYGNIDKLLENLEKVNVRNKKKKEVTIAVGVSKFDGQSEMSEIFDDADAKMYLNKKRMKKGEPTHH
ncbi:bifunctional diguanylate cyclase/phosphodiesterase [Pseudobutyrivibrio xylanivorans]|uniref:Diguanylate cyclase (GGDEF) domain-containing protein n=1 Tax=Pseudobutyrivibrio xylanivorans TaxID=185007 RepID=A0A1G5S0B6_PSEXY|nr:GGDEF domain-containing protein [Pseudobutyrivibrio xylanivorans]SCZ79548.1 diguanylate cyclase (GGDEF) domain-containing protein [Pseudobutyrivibrio xylanivorans]